MTTILMNELKNMSITDLQEIITKCENEIQERKEQERVKLANIFLEAYRALRREGIDIIYYDKYEEIEIGLEEEDAFTFV